jgi:hypothetical protein
LEVAAEESDASSFADLERPDEAKWPAWSDYVRDAWAALRDDRFYGSMGGLGRIYYASLSQYARDHGIPLHPFAEFVMAMDDEFVALQNAKARSEQSNTEDVSDG